MALAAAVMLPNLVSVRRILSMRGIWVTSQSVFGFCMLGTFMTASTVGTILLFGIVGLSWACSTWIPFALLGEQSWSPHPINKDYKLIAVVAVPSGDEKDRGNDTVCWQRGDWSQHSGLLYGLHNLSICLPQILFDLGMEFQRTLSTASGANDSLPGLDVVWPLRLGGVFALLASCIATILQEPE